MHSSLSNSAVLAVALFKCVLTSEKSLVPINTGNERVTHSSVACVCLFCTHNSKKAMKVTHILLVLLWFFCIYAFMPLLRFVQMSRMITEHWSLMASGESWSLVLSITLVALQRFSSLPSFYVCVMLHVNYFFPMFMNFGLKGVVFVVADVARHHSKVQIWRTWCDWDLCFLELTRTSSRPGYYYYYHSSIVSVVHCYLHCIELFFQTCSVIEPSVWFFTASHIFSELIRTMR